MDIAYFRAPWVIMHSCNPGTLSSKASENKQKKKHAVCAMQDLAMKAMVSNITTAVQRLTSTRACHDDAEFLAKLGALQDFLHQSIPVNVWEEMVPSLIDAFILMFENIPEERETLFLTLHPQTRALRSIWQLEALRILDIVERQERLLKMQVLKINTFAPDLLQEALPHLCNLEFFELQYHSTDKIITKLALHCDKLKHLNVYGSRGVTNGSIPAIASVVSLKSLNIAKTSIIAVGLDSFFSQAQQMHESNADFLDLQCLEFSNGIQRNYEKLVTAFPNLRHLGIYYIRSSLEMLSPLQGLTSFLCYDGSFQHLKPLLPALGNQLEHLHLECMQALDLNLVAKHCTMLRSLTLKSIISIKSLPERLLPNIRTLTIDSAQIAPELIQKFISQCNNTETLILQ